MSDHERVGAGTLLVDGRAMARPGTREEHDLDLVHEVLRSIPSHGWPDGWMGRRDRALLVLSECAGLTYEQIAALAAGDVSIADGVAVIRTVGGTTRLLRTDDDLLCGPCALARWVHALDSTVVYPDGRVIAAVIARAVPLTARSPHLCQGAIAVTDATKRVALLPPIDRWGHPFRGAGALPGPPQADPVRGLPRQGGSSPQTIERARGLRNRVSQLLELGPAA